MLTLATYKVNSIRIRLDRVLAWLGRTAYDVVCLQELKVTDEHFPCAELEAAGWHCATRGLADCCVETYVARDERKGKLPSDHAPVVAAFNRA